MKILNKKIHYFNPGHEAAVWLGKDHYTPPAPVYKMMSDLALLPVWYGKKEDSVIINEAILSSRFLSSLPEIVRPPVNPVLPVEIIQDTKQFIAAEAAPWGLSPHSIRFFETIRTDSNLLRIPQWKEVYTQLTGRQTATECLAKVQTILDEKSLTLPRFCSQTDQIRQFMSDYSPPYLMKMPFSCSGRGLHWLPNHDLTKQDISWIQGALRRQKTISIEQALDKVCDFAMEFESDGNGLVQYEGLSVFDTLSKGAFSGNRLGAQKILEKQITQYVPASQLRKVQEAVISVLTETIGSVYQGYLGVDMLIYRQNNSYAIHPFIELNLRYTMGWVAIQLNHNLIHPSARGRFVIACDPTDKGAYNSHLQMEKEYPLQLHEGKIHSGYFSLCPVTPETHYRAYTLVHS